MTCSHPFHQSVYSLSSLLILGETTEVFKVIREEKKLITTTVEEEEDDDDVRSAESQVIERTFGYSDIDSEEPPDSDYNP